MAWAKIILDSCHKHYWSGTRGRPVEGSTYVHWQFTLVNGHGPLDQQKFQALHNIAEMEYEKIAYMPSHTVGICNDLARHFSNWCDIYNQ